jgi:hypothetical protein
MNSVPDLVDHDDEVPYQRIIRDMLNEVWQQPNPHEWQMKGIRKAFVAGTLMALPVPPGSGKTTVMRGVATLLRYIYYRHANTSACRRSSFQDPIIQGQ